MSAHNKIGYTSAMLEDMPGSGIVQTMRKPEPGRWIYQTPAPHICQHPYDGRYGSVWQCNGCKQLWLLEDESTTSGFIGDTAWTQIPALGDLSKLRLNGRISSEAYTACEKLLSEANTNKA